MRKVDETARYDEDLNNWVRQEEDTFTIGVTDFGQEFMGPISLVTDLPKIGQVLSKGTCYCLTESDKASTEIHLPISGKVVAINEALLKNPSFINEDCYGEGWILKLTEVSVTEWDSLKSAEFYAEAVGSFFNK